MKHINLTVKERELIAIVGSIGCGKSTLLLSILNEMPLKIHFGKPYFKEKFDKIIQLCCLEEVHL